MSYRRYFRAASFLILLGLTASAPAAEGLDICEIQGPGLVSPYTGELVETQGVVTFDRDDSWEKGFFIQDPDCDGDPGTSDALFVYTGEQVDLVSLGDIVEVSGWVVEFGGMTEVSAGPAYIEVKGTQPLPPPVLFSPPHHPPAARAHAEDHEGMRIAIGESVVVGPTTAFGDTFVVEAAIGIEHVFHWSPNGRIIRISSDGLFKITPAVGVGAQVGPAAGVLDVRDGDFRLRLTEHPLVDPIEPPPYEEAPQLDEFSFASLNLYNLFDNLDDPGYEDPVLTASAYQTKLEKLARTITDVLGEPYFIAVQEAEKGQVLQSLANRPEIEAQYGNVLVDGPDVRGMDVGLMYRTDRVQVLAFAARQGCTALVDGLGPDGNRDMQNPANALTCDLDGLPGPDGNRLFSRPPLVVGLEICEPDCDPGGVRTPLWVIAVHLKSKTQDNDIEFTLPRRLAQAAHVAGLAAEIQARIPGAGIVILGDINDTLGSETLEVFAGAGLVNLMEGTPRAQRYTYIYEGFSQVLDHVLVSQSLVDPLALLYAEPKHIAADFSLVYSGEPDTYLRASDHDPILVRRFDFSHTYFFPILEASK